MRYPNVMVTWAGPASGGVGEVFFFLAGGWPSTVLEETYQQVLAPTVVPQVVSHSNRFQPYNYQES